MAKYTVSIGEEFDVEVDLVEADDKEPEGQGYHTERMRVMATVFGGAMAFLVGAAVLGVVNGEFSALSGVWSVVAVPVSSIITFYFTKA